MSQPTTAWGLLEAGLGIDPGAPALVAPGAPVDYRTFHATAAALASALREAGVARGDRVALAERNSPAFLTWTFACAGAGAVLVPLNWRLAARE
ncbi:MAG: AMP-binding protein, partial [Planctomycetota bacterium]